ncbi:MAG: RNase adapter RapZ [Ruminococcus sp.]|nr:RNase adapter RapZ [Ruminococcus sp.]
MQFVIVTGMSGSGKSSAVNILEDIGYYCIDNMPPELIGKFADICSQSEGKIEKVAFVVDVRSRGLFNKLQDTIDMLKSENINLKILYIDCSSEVLIRRYKETRRKHPLDEASYGDIRKAVEKEKELLVPIKAVCDYYIDTTNTSVAQFRERMNEIFLENEEYMRIDVRSFGFKYGPLPEGDLIFDVRCLPNPFYIQELKEKTGLDSEVSGYVMKFDEAQELLKKFNELVDFLIPLYEKEGKAQLVIAFGCTGGKHRSVTFAEAMAKHLRESNRKIRIAHRDIEKH